MLRKHKPHPFPWILALALVSLDAEPIVQRVIIEPAFQTVASGDTVTMTVAYDSVDVTLTGLRRSPSLRLVQDHRATDRRDGTAAPPPQVD
jgi:hypothetical protein